MRSLINFLAIVLGGIAIAISIFISSDTQNMQSTWSGRFQNEFDAGYQREIRERNLAKTVFGVSGAILLLVGFVGYFRKSNTKNTSKDTSKNNEVMRLQKIALKHFEKREFNEASGILRRLIGLDSQEGIHHFNLACCLSELKNPEAMKHIALAISKGYADFNKIKTYNSLSWIRKQEGYDAFVKSGYSMEYTAADKKENTTTEKKEASKDSTSDMIEKIEKLANLKEKGMLSQEEYEEQKKKILNS